MPHSSSTPRLPLHALATSALVAGGGAAGGLPLVGAVCAALVTGLLVFWAVEAKRAVRLAIVRRPSHLVARVPTAPTADGLH